MIRFLLWLGLVARHHTTGKICWPLHFAPWHMWKAVIRSRGLRRMHGWFYVFRNVPGVIKWQEGRLLPRRWGFGILGLIEFGDRGH